MKDSSDDRRRPLPDAPPDASHDERAVLLQFLDHHRAVLVRKLQGVDDAGRRFTLGRSTLTLAGLVKHMAYVEDWWFTDRFSGDGTIEPWASAPWDDDHDWELTTAVDDTEGELLALFDAACERSRSVMDGCTSLDDVAALGVRDEPPHSMRWILVHMIEEYARHCGHADLLRETVDGTTGD